MSFLPLEVLVSVKSFNLAEEVSCIFMGRNYQDGKYSLSVSLFVSFYGELKSKLAISEANKKHPVDKYTKESNGIALFLLLLDSI